MVDEFSSFARMPAPSFREEDLAEIVRQNLFLAGVAFPAVTFSADLPDALPFMCDRQQIGQALTNLLKNAAESVEAGGRPGSVNVCAAAGEGRVVVEVRDDGPGFPPELRERLAEPYVTTRARGTGLGLAIVTRIAEDHHGRLVLRDAQGGGAVAALEFTVAGGMPAPADMEAR
jgi:two-component system nitrogen regulation sensor histidine kinase NtrY